MGEPRAARFLIWGGGGHGKVVADLVRAIGGTVHGYIDADRAKLGKMVEPGGGRVVLVQPEPPLPRSWIRESFAGVDGLALAIGDNAVRLSCLEYADGIATPSLIHPSASISPSARLGRGVVVFAGAVVNAAAELGDAVILNSGAIVEHDCRVGEGAHVSPGAVLTGNVHVGARSWIGAGAVVIPNVHIGADVVVGAGAVVVRDVNDGHTIAGVPARPIAKRLP